MGTLLLVKVKPDLLGGQKKDWIWNILEVSGFWEI